MTNSAATNLRVAAAEIIDAVVSRGQSLDAALALHEGRVSERDRSSVRMISYGTLRYHWRLRGWIDQLIQKPLKKKDRVIHALLAAGLFQMTQMRIPDHAVVTETVDAVRLLQRPKLAGLVNACLRRFARESMSNSLPQTVSAEWNHPQWFVETMKRDWPDDWQQILTANDQRAPMWLRNNQRSQSADVYQQQLHQADIGAERHAGLDNALRLHEPAAVQILPAFANGAASVQDGAAQIAAQWLTLCQPQRVLDACAAPGGKTAHLLEAGADDVQVVAIDHDESRLQSVRDTLDRIGRSATILAADASKPEEWWDGEVFDAILLDAPCSATGVVRRHPDIKLLRRASDIQRLAKLQRNLLAALWPLLAPGGQLLYVTCSVIGAENDDVVAEFLQENDQAVENDVLPNNNIRDLMRRKACGYQVLPGTADLDGFYFACLQKQGPG